MPEAGHAGERCLLHLLQLVQIAQTQQRQGLAAARKMAVADIEQARQSGWTWCVARLKVAQARTESVDDRVELAVGTV